MFSPYSPASASRAGAPSCVVPTVVVGVAGGLLVSTFVLAFAFVLPCEPDEHALNHISEKPIRAIAPRAILFRSTISPRAIVFRSSRCCFVDSLFIVLLLRSFNFTCRMLPIQQVG